ncbi:hypothetical protein BX600DRAFT_429152 [Xylariales sp. PMI_506]|nr:hypothetical protein BX600DRAFT_429152 [Xylariales sp. PMI_506]
MGTSANLGSNLDHSICEVLELVAAIDQSQASGSAANRPEKLARSVAHRANAKKILHWRASEVYRIINSRPNGSTTTSNQQTHMECLFNGCVRSPPDYLPNGGMHRREGARTSQPSPVGGSLYTVAFAYINSSATSVVYLIAPTAATYESHLQLDKLTPET